MNNNLSYYQEFKASKLSAKRLDKQLAFNILYPVKLTNSDKQDLAILKREGMTIWPKKIIS